MSLVAHSAQTSAARDPISIRIERELLLALAFVLPLFEAPKNIVWIAFLALWIANRIRARSFGGLWDYWDTLIVSWMASGFIVAAFAGLHGDEWRAAVDIVRYGSVLWALKRSRYPTETWLALIAAIVLGTVAALVWSYYELFHATKYRALNLNSVGHVNQSSGYLAVVCGLTLITIRARWRESGAAGRAVGCAVLTFLVASLFWMQSRAAVGVAFVAMVSLLSVYAARRRESLGRIALAAVGVVAVVLIISPQVVRKNSEFMQKSYWLNGRDEIWRVGLAAWREFPVFGVGMDNFGRVDHERLQAWSAERGEAFERQRFLTAPHGHNLFINTLAERGLFGLGVLLAVLAGWAVDLARRIPPATAPPLIWLYWGGTAGAWIVTVLAGLLNTTLHHEQALLCALLLGGWLSLSPTISPRSPSI
ncbi:MAG TPA: O-antigen ligase family protein [Burkholderiales bacterium]|nr:O-antigen ligase family protein [Burkholderiales bacterium]